MNSKRQTVLAIVATAVISVGTVVAGTVTQSTGHPARDIGEQVGRPGTSFTQTPKRITEDDPAWDCQTMGNRICGPLPIK